ncbi:hypothetical protein AHAS_Ahas20G0120100 [Arachis hypogaea]
MSRNKEANEEGYNKPNHIQAEIFKQIQEMKNAYKKDYLVGRMIERIEIGIRWQPPPEELWGVADGLKLAWRMSLKKIIVECDSAAVVKLLNGGKNLTRHPNPLIHRILELKNYNWRIHFVQC